MQKFIQLISKMKKAIASKKYLKKELNSNLQVKVTRLPRKIHADI